VQRLTFAVKNGTVHLVSEQEVDMQPMAAPAAPPGSTHEFWLEVRDQADATLHTQSVRDPMPKDIEVFSNDPAQSASHAHDPRTEHAFTVVLPSVHGADSVVLMRASPAAHRGAAQALGPTAAGEEIAKFKLSKQ
jgi:hypothetical protein